MLTTDNIPQGIAAYGFRIPRSYEYVHEMQLVNVDPWFFLDDDSANKLFEAMSSRYTELAGLLPFARRSDSDDVACFVANHPEHSANTVLIINIWPDGAILQVLPCFWAWFRLAVDEMIQAFVEEEH